MRECAIVEEHRYARVARTRRGGRPATRETRCAVEKTNIAGEGASAAREDWIARGDSISSVVCTYVAGLLRSLEGRPPPEVDIAPCVATL